jgi:hypothetical protein
MPLSFAPWPDDDDIGDDPAALDVPAPDPVRTAAAVRVVKTPELAPFARTLVALNLDEVTAR